MTIAGLRVREWGNRNEPATLLWPGLGFTGLYFAGLADRLPHALALDPPGYGGSPDLAWDDYALGRLAELVDEIAGEVDAAAFVGHSFGATVGATLGALHPSWLRALVLVDGGFISGTERARFGLPDARDRETLLEYVSHAKSDHASWEDAFAELREAFGGAWPAHAEMLTRELFADLNGRVQERGSIEAGAAILGGLAEHDAAACAQRIRDARVPTLVIAAGGTQYHEPKRDAWQRFAAAGSPAVQLHVDEQVGHHLLLESPDIYVPLITRWLRDVRIR